MLRIFERKILRKICGPIQEGDTWRIRNNEELNRSINGEDIVKFIKAQRIRWMGHVTRMEVGAMPRKMLEGRLFIGRRKGRPRLRWMDDVAADLKSNEDKAVDGEDERYRANGDWLLRRPRLTRLVASRGWMDGWILGDGRATNCMVRSSELGTGDIFPTSPRPAPRATQLLVKWVPGNLPGDTAA